MKTALKVVSWITLGLLVIVLMASLGDSDFSSILTGSFVFGINPVTALLYIKEVEKE
jgi:hypothetical protein